jgi:hypothetical protein
MATPVEQVNGEFTPGENVITNLHQRLITAPLFSPEQRTRLLPNLDKCHDAFQPKTARKIISRSRKAGSHLVT